MTTALPIVARPKPMFLGYALKAYLPRPTWHEDQRVRFIGSVTECNAARPDGWTDRWDFNAAGYYETPEDAEAACCGELSRDRFAMFAYELFPLRFFGGHVAAVQEAAVFEDGVQVASRHLAPGFEFIGYDAVERWAEPTPGKVMERALAGGFGCSPLYCNSLSKEHPVNSYCLVSEWSEAVAAAHRFGIEQPEPGCYYVFGVYLRAPNC